MTPRRLPRRILVPAAIVAGLAIGFALAVARFGGLEGWLTRDRPGPTYEARGALVEVDGRSIYLDCRGSGSPTVILEAGLGSGADSWGTLLDSLAGTTRTCAWDRPGIGRSAPRAPHSGGQTAADLQSVLTTAGERGPYVAVGHSVGGVYVRLFAASEGDPVAAVVMLDTYDPDLGMDEDPSLDQAFRDQIRRGLDETGASIQQIERLDWAATLAELDAIEQQPPMLVLSTDPYRRYQDPDPARREGMVAAWRRAITALYPGAQIEIVPDAGHFIHQDRPDLVLARVREIVLRVRASG